MKKVKLILLVLIGVLLTGTGANADDPDQFVELPTPVPVIDLSEVYIPPFANDTLGWDNFIMADNLGTECTTFTVTLYGYSGEEVYSGDYDVDCLDRTSIDLNSLEVDAQCGKITYACSQLNFRLARINPEGGITEYVLNNALYSYLGFFYNDLDSSIEWKGLALSNLGGTYSIVTLTVIGGGEELDSVNVMVGPNQTIDEFHDTFFADIELSEIDAITALSSTYSISGIVMSGGSSSSTIITPAPEIKKTDRTNPDEPDDPPVFE